MANAISITTASRLAWSLVDDPAVGAAGESYESSSALSVSNGTGSGQANAAWVGVVAIPAGQVLALDVTALATEKFSFNGVVNFSVIKEVLVINRETEAGRHVLYGVSSPSDTTGYAARINRSGEHKWADYADGVSINASNKMIYIANPGTAEVTLEIAMAGVGTYVST